MAWERLDEVANKVVSRLVVDGEDGVAALSVKPGKGKAADAEAPAQVNREVLPAKEGDANRRMATASKAGRPTPAVAIRLFVIEGGRTTGGGETVVRPIAQATRGRMASNSYLRLVVG